MPVLKNARHGKFAQELAKGKSADEAYEAAGHKPHRGNASALKTNQIVFSRVAEIQGRAVECAAVAIQSLIDKLEHARGIAIGEKQTSTAVAAALGKAKLHGLLIDKKQHAGPNGGAIPINLTNVSDDQLAALKAIFGPLAGETGDDDEGDQGGGSEEVGGP